MSAVTLNLRIAPGAQQKLCNKSSRQKSAEILPEIPEHLKFLLQDDKVESLVNAQLLEPQIVGLRKVSWAISSSILIMILCMWVIWAQVALYGTKKYRENT
jgi:hypothetical protein